MFSMICYATIENHKPVGIAYSLLLSSAMASSSNPNDSPLKPNKKYVPILIVAKVMENANGGASEYFLCPHPAMSSVIINKVVSQ